MKLLDSAKAVKTRTYTPAVDCTAPLREQVEVAVAYLKGEIRLSQASAVLAPNKSRSIAQFAIVPILRRAMECGLISIHLRRGE